MTTTTSQHTASGGSALQFGATERLPELAGRMAEAASAFLASLQPKQRERAAFPFDSEERYAWHWVPSEMRARFGLRLVNMSTPQQQCALGLAATGLSPRGFLTLNRIRRLDAVLRDTERGTDLFGGWWFIRDPELYYFAVFGTPGTDEPWGWSVAGHHVALNFTIADGVVSPLPLFFGANPSQVRHGPDTGLRTLPEEEDRARALLRCLDPLQRASAVVKDEAPLDLFTEPTRCADPSQVPLGLRYESMTGEQRQRLVELIRLYVDRACDGVAEQQWRSIERAGLDGLTFAWMGGSEPGQGHYYAIRGPRTLIEYDNIQDGANHIHSLWRDLAADFGGDVLADHYAHSPHHEPSRA